MATIGTAATLADMTKRLNADGDIDAVVEVLTATNSILDQMVWVEGNLATGHRTTIRRGLPQAYWRVYNKGVVPDKSITAQVTDTCGMLESRAQIDVKLARLNGNTQQWRASEDTAFIQAFNDKMAETLFYGDVDIYPDRFMGLTPRYNDKDAESAENIVDGGGAGTDNTSIWLVCWGQQTVHGIFPKGSKAGFNRKDLGEQTVEDGNGGKYQAYSTLYEWDCGLTVRDWRYVSRIANIDVSALSADPAASGTAKLIDLMVEAIERLPDVKMGTPAFYCNRHVRTRLRQQISNKSNVWLGMDEVAGRKVMTFDGIPVHRCDALLETEARYIPA